MTQVLIMGDSWGVPDYTRVITSAPYPSKPFYSDAYHTEHFLEQLKYDVHNASHGGISNIIAIRNARTRISNYSLKPDYIIWFHTALFRDYVQLVHQIDLRFTYEKTIEVLAHEVYNKMKLFLEENRNSKLIVIGGQAPIVKDIFDLYINPLFCIYDWRSEILNEKLPQFQAYGSENILPSWNWDDKVMKRMKSLSNLYTEKMAGEKDAKDPLFPDGCHPGRKPHYDLSRKIHAVMNHGYTKGSAGNAL